MFRALREMRCALDAATAAGRLPGRGGVAPSPPLLDGVLPPAARVEPPSRQRPAPFTCSCSRRSSRSWLRRWRASRSPVTTRSSHGPRRASSTYSAVASPHLGGRGGDAVAVNRAADVAIAGLGLAVRALCSLRPRSPSSSRIVGRFLPSDTGGQGRARFRLLKLRTMVVGAERKGAGVRGRQGRFAHHPRRPAAAAAHVDRRAAAALERAPRRDVHRRAATDAALPGRALHRPPAPTSRRAPGLTGWAQVNGRAASPGGPDRARRLVRRAPHAWARPADPPARRSRCSGARTRARPGLDAGRV